MSHDEVLTSYNELESVLSVFITQKASKVDVFNLRIF